MATVLRPGRPHSGLAGILALHFPFSPMPSSHEREQALFTLAVAKPAAERAAFLDRECAGDPALRQRLETLIAALDRPEPMLDARTDESKPTIIGLNIGSNNELLLQVWRAPSWEEIKRAEALN
jgi:hypothetical protein